MQLLERAAMSRRREESFTHLEGLGEVGIGNLQATKKLRVELRVHVEVLRLNYSEHAMTCPPIGFARYYVG